jgi:hemoglobin/transferrin/lactoferrin receptor protein
LFGYGRIFLFEFIIYLQMNKVILAFLLSVLLVANVAAQIVTVLDQTTLKPLELLTIVSQVPKVSVYTNSKGKAEVSGFKTSTEIQFRYVGYTTKTLSYEQLAAKNFKILLSQNSITLDHFVVSATRWEQSQKDVPQHIATINAESVALQNPQTAADLLATSGEVFIQKSQLGGGSPMIRGFSTNRILITVDGVRMNNAIFRSGNLQNVISIDPFTIAKTEVLFGPGSLIYGSDAMGGVMSFSTLAPKLSNDSTVLVTVNALARYSSAANEKTGHIDFNIGLKKLAFISSITFTDYDDLLMGSNGPDDYLRPEYAARINGNDSVVPNENPKKQVETGYNQLNLMQKIRFKPNEKWELNYGFHYSSSSDVPRYDRLTFYRNNQLRSAEWYYGPQIWIMNVLSATHTGMNSIYDHVNVNAAFQIFEESRHDRNFGSSDKRHLTEKVNAYSLGIDFDKTIGEKHTLYFGVEAVYNQINSKGELENILTSESVAIASRYPDGATWGSYAVYINDQFKLSKKMTLQGGLRYNLINLQADFDTSLFALPVTSANLNTGALTGSLGIVYRPNESWQLSLHGSTGFRSPNVDDIGKIFDSAPGLVMVPNASLKPEYAWNGELNISKIFAETAKFDLTGFYTLLDNALVRRDFQMNGADSVIYAGELSRVQAIQNAAQATVYGFQAGLEIKLPAGFGLSGRFNYQFGEEELDNGDIAPLRHAAPWFGVTRITYKRDKLRTELYALWSGGVSNSQLAPEEQNKSYLYALDSSGKPFSPAWYTLNLKAVYQIGKNLMVSGGIENITDVRYRPYSSGISAPGRNFIASVKASF